MINGLYIKKNVGPVDRAIRLALGAALVVSPVFLKRSPGKTAALSAVGGSTILEGIIGY